MTRDGIGIAETVSHLLGRKKIIITGFLGLRAGSAHDPVTPDLFHGYVGVSQW